MDEGGGVCRSEGVAAACRQSCFLFKSFLEGEEVILPRLQGLVFRYFAVPLGAVLWEGVCLEDQGRCDGSKKVVRNWEAGVLRLFLAFHDPVQVLWYVGVLLPHLCEGDE